MKHSITVSTSTKETEDAIASALAEIVEIRERHAREIISERLRAEGKAAELEAEQRAHAETHEKLFAAKESARRADSMKVVLSSLDGQLQAAQKIVYGLMVRQEDAITRKEFSPSQSGMVQGSLQALQDLLFFVRESTCGYSGGRYVK